ncbi:MAG: helix-turn-helix domain-containing protein [Nocardioides sp.]
MTSQQELESTETRLVRAAERLFAEHGVGAVSLRAVMQEANANVASVHYHFGSKEALVEAVVRSRYDELSIERQRHIDHLDQLEEIEARDLARVVLMPLVAVAEHGGHDWLRVVGHLLSTNDPSLASLSALFLERSARVLELLAGLQPSTPKATIDFRLIHAITVALYGIGNDANMRTLMQDLGVSWTPEEATSQLLDVVASVLAGNGSATQG